VKDEPGPQWLREILHEQVPLSRAMGLDVTRLDVDGIELTAPLQLNHNHAGTAFAGSLYAIAALAGWGYLRYRVAAAGLDAHLVLADGSIRYPRPYEGNLRCVLEADAGEVADALERVAGGRRARLDLTTHLPDPETPAAVFTGRFAALPQRPQEAQRHA
jgi:thioesterase domain-containing protein